MKKQNNEDDEYNPTNAIDQSVKKAIHWAIFGIVLIIVLIILFGSSYTIDAGDRGIVLTFGKASSDISQPGIHLKLPIIQKVVVYSVRTQTIAFDNPADTTATPSEYDALSSASKDLQTVQTAVIINYHINEKDVLNIYQQYGDSKSYQANILEPIIRNTVKATTAHYNANDLVDNREAVVNEVTTTLTQQFNIKNAVLDNFNIVNFQYSKQYSDAIEAKVTAQQNALTEQNKLLAVQYQAQQRVAQAEGEAKAIAIQAQAVQVQGGASYVELQRIARWDGHYPMFMGSGASPILDMRNVAGYYSANSS